MNLAPPPDPFLLISEIYPSIQGESRFSGLPCMFIRLTGCDLRCNFCDSAYSFTGGSRMSLPTILEKVQAWEGTLVEITGGEPLLQKNVIPLMTRLCDMGKSVLLETSGAHDISPVDSRVVRIVDVKCPTSGESHRNRIQNFDHLKPHDELKFVIGSREDFDWACAMISKHSLLTKSSHLFFSPTFKTAAVPGQIKGHEGIDPKLLADWILQQKVPVRMQLQIHKYIWEPTARGV